LNRFGFRAGQAEIVSAALKFVNGQFITKYDEDQPRDENGRFGSGGSVPTPIDPTSDTAVSEQLNFQRALGFTAENNPPEWEAALEQYTNGSGTYNDINGILREGPAYAESVMLSPTGVTEVQGYIASLDALMEAAPPLPEASVTYRGIKDEAAEQFLALNVGDSFTEAGYASTSWVKEVAEGFADPDEEVGGAILEIINPAGTQGLSTLGYRMEVINQWVAEKEWLLPRGTTFDVVAKEGNVLTVKVRNE
jgi:hypothetical protein